MSTRTGESVRPDLMVDLAGAADPITVDDVATRVTIIEGAIRAGGDRLDPEAVANARVMVERTGERLQLGPRYTIVALVGATGSGKSTLFNALATMELAETGVKRPTTSRPMACVWGDTSVHPLLDWLDISPRRRTLRETVLDADRERALHGLVLLDLPDHDSTQVTHRLEVDRLVELVDLLVWVVDPQKYGDEALHSGYLKRLVNHDGVMMVVLNQTDKLSPSEAATCRTDLRRLLDADRLQSVPILTTSALNGEGVDELRSVLADIVDVQDAVAQRVVADLDAAARRLRDGVADSEPDGTRLEGADELVGTLAQAAGLPVVLDGVTAQHRRLGEQATGWPWLTWWRRLRGDNLSRLDLTGEAAGEMRALMRPGDPSTSPAQEARVDVAVRAVTSSVAHQLPRPWAEAVRLAARRPDSALVTALDAALDKVDLTIAPPAWWRLAGGLQWLLAGVAALGLLWSLVAGVGALAHAGFGSTPTVAGLPLPVVLLVAGLLLGGGLALLSRQLVARGAAQHRSRVAAQMRDAVQDVAWEQVVAPVAEVLHAHRQVRELLDGVR